VWVQIPPSAPILKDVSFDACFLMRLNYIKKNILDCVDTSNEKSYYGCTDSDEKGDLMKYDCIVGTLREINALSEKHFSKRIKEMNLPILENHIPLFYVLPPSGEAKRYNEIVADWGISKSSISDFINKYVKLGYLIKYPDKEDKRTIYVQMTNEGMKIRECLNEIEEEILTQFFNGFDSLDIKYFTDKADLALNNIHKL